MMEKYDMELILVVDLQYKLVGRIIIDDVVDIIKEEVDKDFQLVFGIFENIELNVFVWWMLCVCLLWLFIGMLGGIFSVQVIFSFEISLIMFFVFVFFIFFIMVMGGNVGVQFFVIVV